MAKDPAFLFYPNDYIGGTMGMTFEEKGAYIELLMTQFNRGHMTEHMIGQIVGQLWDKLKDKFIKDDNGLYYNVRLEEEKIKRQNFTNSRRNNISGNNQHTKKEKNTNGHMTEHMENVNVNKFSFKQSMLDYGFLENLVDDWIKVRKTKKATNTKTAFEKFINQVESISIDKNEILRICVEKSWSGFNSEWIKEQVKKSSQPDISGIV